MSVTVSFMCQLGEAMVPIIQFNINLNIVVKGFCRFTSTIS